MAKKKLVKGLWSKSEASLLRKLFPNNPTAKVEYLLKAAIGRLEKLGLQHPHTKESIENLIELYEAWNKPEQAEKWRVKLPQKEAKTE